MTRVGAAARSDAKKAVGILTTRFGDVYSTPVGAGVVDVMRERGIEVIFFAGGPPPREQTDQEACAFFDLASPVSIDGVVLMSGLLTHVLSPAHLEAFANRYAGLPRVSIAAPLPGCSSVLVDSEKGLCDVIAHLIDVHAHRRIGFIAGPKASEEAQERRAVYQSVLEQHGLSVDPQWIAEGGFDFASGKRAVQTLFDERRVSLDAVVVANDQMALGAMEALEERGVRVPYEVAIVGFDDTEMSNYVTPSLTTVRQPLYQLGRQAALHLVAMLEGAETPETVVLETEQVIRESCGCSSSLHTFRRSQFPVAEGGLEASLSRGQARIVTEMQGTLGGPWSKVVSPERLLHALVHDLRVPGAGRFLGSVEDILRARETELVEVWAWQRVIAVIRLRVLPWIAADPLLLSRAENLWLQASVLVGDRACREEAQKRVVSERRARALAHLNQALIGATNLGELAQVVGERFPALGVSRFWISLYDDAPAAGSSGSSRLLMSSDQLGKVSDSSPAARFESRRLVPAGTLDQDEGLTLVAAPLAFRDLQLGFVVFAVSGGDRNVYDDLPQQLSSAIMRVKREEELARLYAAQQERSRELEEAYRATKENQERLLTSAKMAALGRLTAGMAHEMNTPLAAVRMALEELGKLTEEYGSALSDHAITPADHAEIAKEMGDSIRLATNAAEKVAGFVHGIKSQTRDLSSKEFRRFGAVPVIADTILLLNHALRKANCTIAFEYSDTVIEVYGSPGRLAQVVTNLVTNAIDASRGKGGGPIRLALSPKDDAVELIVSDQGSGIPAEIVKRIFDPMFTTKPFGEGTGLGLSIVHNIVSSDFNGTIEVDTEVGRGTQFILCFRDPEGARA